MDPPSLGVITKAQQAAPIISPDVAKKESTSSRPQVFGLDNQLWATLIEFKYAKNVLEPAKRNVAF